MIKRVQISDILRLLHDVNKYVYDLGIRFYILLDRDYCMLYMQNGDDHTMIFKSYHGNVDKIYRELYILKHNTIDALCRSIGDHYPKRRNKHLIYFNF